MKVWRFSRYNASNHLIRRNDMAERASGPIPQGMNSLTTTLVYNGNCLRAIEWYKTAMDATPFGEVNMSPDGSSVWHAVLQLGNSQIMLSDAFPGTNEVGPGDTTTAGLWYFTDDCDATFNKALEHGAKSLMPPMDAFWGDRMGKLADPFGHVWVIATRQWNYTPEEIEQNLQNWLASMQQG